MADRFVLKNRSGTVQGKPFDGIGIWDTRESRWASSDLYPDSSRGRKPAKSKVDRMNRIDQSK